MNDDRRSKYLSIGRKMPGMADWGQNTASGIVPSKALRAVIRETSLERGAPICIAIQDNKLVQNDLRLSSSCETWEDILGELATAVPHTEACYVLVFREVDTLLVTYVPEEVPPKEKMLYASSKFSLKICLSEKVEEFNVTSKDELSFDEYKSRNEIEAPLTEHERFEKDLETTETGGGYSLLARLMGKKQVPMIGLPGLSNDTTPAFADKDDGSESETPSEDHDAENNSSPTTMDSVVEEETPVVSSRLSTPAELYRSSVQSVRASLRSIHQPEHDGGEDAPATDDDDAQSTSSTLSKLKKRISSSFLGRKTSTMVDTPVAAPEPVDTPVDEPVQTPETSAADVEEPAPITDIPVETENQPVLNRKRYTYKSLLKKKANRDQSIDLTRLEMYLSEKSFEKHFGCTKNDFEQFPMWKQRMVKKRVGLF